MAADTIDKLLTSLSVRSHAFAVCAIRSGLRLAFDPLDAVTLHYVLAGSGSVRVNGGAAVAYGPCCLVVVPAGLEQSLGEDDATATERASDTNCGLLADGLVTFTAGDGSRDTLVACATITATYAGALGVFDGLRAPFVEDFSRSDLVRGAFATLLGEVSDPGLGTQALVEALMKQCLILLLRHHLTRRDAPSPLLATMHDPRLARAVAVVMERPADAYSVEGLAAVAGMSRSVFAERFADAFAQTPMEFVGRVRLRLGADLLRTTALPIKVIAASTGYSSPTYFSRAFRDVHGIDPRSFRAGAAQAAAISDGARRPSVAERVLGSIGAASDGAG